MTTPGLVSPPSTPWSRGGDTPTTTEAWETWGVAARWNPQHGWHNPGETDAALTISSRPWPT